jgi:serine acetyltransferase
VEIGDNCKIGVNAVVLDSFPQFSVVASIAAQLIRKDSTVSIKSGVLSKKSESTPNEKRKAN